MSIVLKKSNFLNRNAPDRFYNYCVVNVEPYQIPLGGVGAH